MKSKLTEKLKSYSIVAGAVVTFSTTGNSQVIYKDIDDVTLNGTSGDYNLDFDGCGQNDFILKVTTHQNTGFTISSIYNSAQIIPENSNYILATNLLVKAVTSGQLITSSSNFRDDVKGLQYYSLYIQRSTTQTVTTTTSQYTTSTVSGTTIVTNTITNTITNTFTNTYTSFEGRFGGQGDEFIGVRFEINGNMHHGWVRVEVSANADQIIIKDYAYEATPNAPINVGAVPNLTTAVDIPNVLDISDYGNAYDVEISFNKIANENLAAGYRVFLVPENECFTIVDAENIPSENYTNIALTGANQVVRLETTTKDINGNFLYEDSYKVFILTIADGINTDTDNLSEPSASFSLTENISTTAINNLHVVDVSDAGNGSDLKVSFNSILDQSTASEYRIMVVKTVNAGTFDIDVANSVITEDYTSVALATKDLLETTLASNAKDVDGDAIVNNVSYTIFVLTVSDGQNASINALSDASSEITLTGNIQTSPTTNIAVSDISDNNNGSDLQIDFSRISDESLASEYRIMVVKSADAATFDLAMANAVASDFTVVNTGTSGAVVLANNAADVNGDAIANGTAYKVFVLTIADGTNSSINALSDASSEITLTMPTVATTGVTAEDVSNNNNGSDLQIGFSRISDENLAAEYRIMVVKSADAATFDLAMANAVASNFTVVNTGTSGAVVLANNATDVNGDAIANGTAYKVFVLTIADGTNSSINALSIASDEITLVDTSIDIAKILSEDVNIYPNPSDGIFTINSKSLIGYTVEIIDVNGRVIYLSKIEDDRFEVDFSKNPSGIYYLQFKNSTNSFVKKLIIKK